MFKVSPEVTKVTNRVERIEIVVKKEGSMTK